MTVDFTSKPLQSSRKLQILEFLECKSWVAPSEFARLICPTARAAYVYLKKLHRYGLLLRSSANGRVRYRISQRGLERLDFLRSGSMKLKPSENGDLGSMSDGHGLR